MHGRLLPTLGAVIVLAAAGVSGCVDRFPGFLSEGGGQITAMEARDPALEAARAWDPHAVLVGVTAVEAPNATPLWGVDAAVGDGLAPAWTYAFTSANGSKARAFHVMANGHVEVTNGSRGMDDLHPDTGGNTTPIARWSIDSDRAMALARENATFRDALAAPGALAILSLGAQENTTAWALVAGHAGAQVVALVDAVDGILLHVEAVHFDLRLFHLAFQAQGEPLHLEGEGTVDGDAPVAEHPFNATGPLAGTLNLTVDPTLPLDEMAWEILDGKGQAVGSGRWGGPGREAGGSAQIRLEEGGPHVLRLAYAPPTHSTPVTPPGPGGVDYAFVLHLEPAPAVDG